MSIKKIFPPLPPNAPNNFKMGLFRGLLLKIPRPWRGMGFPVDKGPSWHLQSESELGGSPLSPKNPLGAAALGAAHHRWVRAGVNESRGSCCWWLISINYYLY